MGRRIKKYRKINAKRYVYRKKESCILALIIIAVCILYKYVYYYVLILRCGLRCLDDEVRRKPMNELD